MSEAHGLRDIEEGRTADGGLTAAAIILAAGGGALAYRNIKGVRTATHYVGRKFGLMTNLPKNWVKKKNDNNETYYYNTVTHARQDNIPRAQPHNPNALEDHWETHTDDDGVEYYYNKNSDVSTYDRPDPAGKRKPPQPRKPGMFGKSRAAAKEEEPEDHEEHEEPEHHEPPKQRGKHSAPKAAPKQTPRTQVDANKQPTGKKGKGNDPKTIGFFEFPQETKLFANITFAVQNLEGREGVLTIFFKSVLSDAHYNKKFVKLKGLDVDQLKAMGLKRKSPIKYSGTDKNAILDALIQQEKDFDQERITNLVAALKDTGTELSTLTKTITTSRANKSTDIKDIKSIFAPVSKGLVDFEKKLKGVRVAYNFLKPTLEIHNKVLSISTLGFLSACQAAVLAYTAKLKTKKEQLHLQ